MNVELAPVGSLEEDPSENWVLAWPNSNNAHELEWLLGTMGEALARAGQNLAIWHQKERDGDVARIRNVLDASLARLPERQAPRVRLLTQEQPADPSQLASRVRARITRFRLSHDPRAVELAKLHVPELRTPDDVERLLGPAPTVRPFDRWRQHFADVQGWFSNGAAAVWDSLLTFQQREGTRGNLLEIGVFYGRSALLSTLHSTEDEQCYLVDTCIRGSAERQLASVRRSGVHFIEAASRRLTPRSFSGSEERSYRWINIDGEHSGFAAHGDLSLATELLGEGGIIVVDDFFSPMYPQVTWAVFEFLRANPQRLMMFLCGFQKAYLCNPKDGRRMLRHVAEGLIPDLVELGTENVTLVKSNDPLDLNCFGLVMYQGWEGIKYRGPDDAEDEIRY